MDEIHNTIAPSGPSPRRGSEAECEGEMAELEVAAPQLHPPASEHDSSSIPKLSTPAPSPGPDVVLINVAGTRYSVVSMVAEELGMAVTEDNVIDCDLLWIDSGIGTERFLNLKHYQHVNHFPGMGEICRKDSLGRNMERLRKLHKEEYNFVPRTWVLPSEYHSLSYYMRELKRKRKNKTFIIKPHNSAMGNGISLTRSVEDVHKDQNVVIQEYLEKPFLLDGFKIDLRVYVLITCCNPLRVFVYKDGLVRLSTQPYIPPNDSNLDKHYMHLTNYSINKHSDTFDSSEEVDQGSKRTLQYFNNWLSQNGYSVGELWAKIYDIIIKTLLVTSPHLVHSYQACRPGRGQDEKSQFFEILGFDIFLDDQLSPWLLEVNRAPSFATDSKLDLKVKTGVIKDALRIVNLQPCDKKKEMVAHRTATRRRLSHTPSKCSRYDFLAEQEGAVLDLERKKKEVRERLEQLRREKEQLEHEQQCMGGYIRVYPTTDWSRDKLYKDLIKSASAITLIGEKNRGSSGSHCREASPIHKMKEHELMDLLSQYEDEEKSSVGFAPVSCPSGLTYQPLSIESSSPMDNVYKAMAARVAEEEQTQRTMIALNEMKPAYPGKSSKQLNTVLEQIDLVLESHLADMASFWLFKLDLRQRKQLLSPLKETLTSILCCYWRTDRPENIRLHHIFKRLFNFLLSSGGKGLWAAFEPKEKSWEELFKKKSSVISVIEMVCCRRIVELSQAVVKAAYYYHYLHYPASNKPRPNRYSSPCYSSSHQSSGISTLSRSPSLPTISKTPTPLLSGQLRNLHSHTTGDPTTSTPHVTPRPAPAPSAANSRSYQFNRRKSRLLDKQNY